MLFVCVCVCAELTSDEALEVATPVPSETERLLPELALPDDLLEDALDDCVKDALFNNSRPACHTPDVLTVIKVTPQHTHLVLFQPPVQGYLRLEIPYTTDSSRLTPEGNCTSAAHDATCCKHQHLGIRPSPPNKPSKMRKSGAGTSTCTYLCAYQEKQQTCSLHFGTHLCRVL